ncbi:MAG: LiaI-LiaF-like domain-containing protein [Bacteroidota bacterium]
METKPGFRITPQIVLGVLIILVGVILTLDRMDVIYAGDFLRLWPSLLIVYGISKLTTEKGDGIAAYLFIGVGGILLLGKLDIIDVRFRDLWPLFLIFIGGVLVWRTVKRRNDISVLGGERISDSNDTISGLALLGGVERTNSSQNFLGGELTAIMGGCEVDLRQASIKNGEAVIDVFAVWGGIDIKVPEDWAVSINGTPILGGIEDKTRPPKGGSTKNLVIRGTAIMGGVEVKN